MFGKIALGAAALTTAAGGGLAATGGPVDGAFHPHRGTQHDMPQEMHAAIEANDFDAWYDVVTSKENSPFADIANEALFADMVHIHELQEAGDQAGAQAARDALRETYNLPEQPRHGMQRQHGGRAHMDATVHQAVHEAVEERNFEAWAEILRENGAPEDRITEDQFNHMIEHMEARPNERFAS